MGSVLPSAILCVSLGLLLAFEVKRIVWAALILLMATAIVIANVSIPDNWQNDNWQNIALWGCWASVIVTALLVQLPTRKPKWVLLGLATNAGIWVGALLAIAGKPTDLLLALPGVFVALPAAWLLKTPARLGVNIAAGWLVAIAILAAAIPLTKTPGYAVDHIE